MFCKTCQQDKEPTAFYTSNRTKCKEMVIRSRSGLAFNRGLHAFHGTIDADYRGEIKVLLTAEDMLPFEIKAGERIAQATIQDAPQYRLEWADELSDTARGAGGFGSSGK